MGKNGDFYMPFTTVPTSVQIRNHICLIQNKCIYCQKNTWICQKNHDENFTPFQEEINVLAKKK